MHKNNDIKTTIDVFFLLLQAYNQYENMHIHLRTFIMILAFLALAATGAEAQKDTGELIRKAIAASEDKNIELSMELLNKAKERTDREKDPEQFFWIQVNFGINYADMLDYDNAFECFFDAYKLALEKLDKRHEMSIMNNIAGLYALNKNYDKANEYYKKIYEYASAGNDSTFTGGVALNIASTALTLGLNKECRQYLETAEAMLRNNEKEMMHLESVRIQYLYANGEYASVIERAEQIIPLFDAEADKMVVKDILKFMISSYIQSGKPDKAITICKEVLGGGYHMEYNQKIFELLTQAYIRKGDYKTAINYKDSVIKYTDSLYKINGQKQFENNRVKFELIKKEQEVEELKNKRKIETIIFIFSAAIMVVMAWALVNEYIKNKQQKKINILKLEQEKNTRTILENKLKEQETEARHERDRLQHEIELKNRELMSKALFIANKNDAIENIIDSLSKNKSIDGNEKLKENLQELKKQLNDNEEWENFTSYFEQVNKGFIQKLRERHPNLTANEIRFISLVYLNLNNKEISSLLNITPEYCKKKKQQIAQKMGLASTTQMYQYLAGL